MLLTGRGLGLLLAGAIPLGLAGFWPAAWIAATLWLVIAVAMLVGDFALAKPADLEVHRRCDGKLSLAAWNAVRVVVQNRKARRVAVAVRDEFPVGFQSDATVLSAGIPARGEVELSYRVMPLRRGDYRFGDLNIRYNGRLGLIVRQERYRASVEVKVYPNLLEMRRYDLLAQRGRLLDVGLRRTRLVGRGTSFERLREYQRDDDYRQINWKATARRGRPVSVEYETERSQNVVLLLDAGRLMAAPVGPLAKLDYAVNTALMLAYVATRLGDNAGLLAFADRVGVHLPPRRGRRQFLAMLDALYNLAPQPSEPDYDLAFRYLAAHERRRALLVLFTDLIDAETSRVLVGHLGVLARHHLTVCVTITDPGVLSLANAAPSDSERLYSRAVAADLLAERRKALDVLRHRGGITLDVAADALTPAVINRYLELKARTRL